MNYESPDKGFSVPERRAQVKCSFQSYKLACFAQSPDLVQNRQTERPTDKTITLPLVHACTG